MNNIFYFIIFLLYSCSTHNVSNNGKHVLLSFDNSEISFSYPENWILINLDLKNDKIVSFASKKTTKKYNNFNYSSVYVTFSSLKYNRIKFDFFFR